MSSTAAGAAFLLRSTSATTNPLLRHTSATTNPLLHLSSPKSKLLRLHSSRRRRLPVPRLSLTPPDTASSNSAPSPSPPPPSATPPPPLFPNWSPPRPIWRGLSALLLAGQVFHRVLTGRIHRRNLLAQLRRVGPGSAGVSLLTAAFVGMAFTIQFVREFTRLGLHRSVGGVLALALARELTPVVTAVVAAGRVGSAFAAELGTMQVSEQTDTLRVLGAQPIDYLVVPRVLACVLALPVLTLISFALGLASSAFLADAIFGVFGAIIAVVSCAWGVTTHGGAKGVGESTTSAVVISLVGIFIADFALSCLFFQGAGDSLKHAMG
ncbi:hypothetical protein BRADI_5g17820v3 [Brachypodium distachyon]|uniref:Uncharacterized protein n=1 Tax=Brachypodium distachyon TaxID=15368 RepID=A0A0Q3KUS3_BRADI|nr:hypothetical protein BRADI_5g17820v3 [Brachypodium distachyon]